MSTQQLAIVVFCFTLGQYEVCLNNKFNFAHTKVVSIDLAISKELTSHEDYEDDEEGGEPPAPSPSEQTEGDDPFQKSDQDEFDTIKKVETMLVRFSSNIYIF